MNRPITDYDLWLLFAVYVILVVVVQYLTR